MGRYLRDVMDRTVAKLHKLGTPITHADLQAVIWFPEQRYWQQRLGVGTGKTDADYEDAAVIALMNAGHEDHVRSEYRDMGYSQAEVSDKINARRTLADRLLKNKKPATDEEADDE